MRRNRKLLEEAESRRTSIPHGSPSITLLKSPIRNNKRESLSPNQSVYSAYDISPNKLSERTRKDTMEKLPALSSLNKGSRHFPSHQRHSSNGRHTSADVRPKDRSYSFDHLSSTEQRSMERSFSFKELFGDEDASEEFQNTGVSEGKLNEFNFSVVDDDDTFREPYRPQSSLLRQTLEDEHIGVEIPKSNISKSEYDQIETEVEREMIRLREITRKELLPELAEKYRIQKIQEKVKQKQEHKHQIVDGLLRIDQVLHNYEQTMNRNELHEFLDNDDISELIYRNQVTKDGVIKQSTNKWNNIMEILDSRLHDRKAILQNLKSWIEKHGVQSTEEDVKKEMADLERDMSSHSIETPIVNVQSKLITVRDRLNEIFHTYRDLKMRMNIIENDDSLRVETRRVFLEGFQERLGSVEENLGEAITDIDEANTALLVFKVKYKEKEKAVKRLLDKEKDLLSRIENYKELYHDQRKVLDGVTSRVKVPEIERLIDVEYILTGNRSTSAARGCRKEVKTEPIHTTKMTETTDSPSTVSVDTLLQYSGEVEAEKEVLSFVQDTNPVEIHIYTEGQGKIDRNLEPIVGKKDQEEMISSKDLGLESTKPPKHQEENVSSVETSSVSELLKNESAGYEKSNSRGRKGDGEILTPSELQLQLKVDTLMEKIKQLEREKNNYTPNDQSQQDEVMFNDSTRFTGSLPQRKGDSTVDQRELIVSLRKEIEELTDVSEKISRQEFELVSNSTKTEAKEKEELIESITPIRQSLSAARKKTWGSRTISKASKTNNMKEVKDEKSRKEIAGGQVREKQKIEHSPSKRSDLIESGSPPLVGRDENTQQTRSKKMEKELNRLEIQVRDYKNQNQELKAQINYLKQINLPTEEKRVGDKRESFGSEIDGETRIRSKGSRRRRNEGENSDSIMNKQGSRMLDIISTPKLLKGVEIDTAGKEIEVSSTHPVKRHRTDLFNKDEEKCAEELLAEVDLENDNEELKALLHRTILEKEVMIELIFHMHTRTRKYYEFLNSFINSDQSGEKNYSHEDFVSDWAKLNRRLDRNRRRISLDDPKEDTINEGDTLSPQERNDRDKTKHVSNREYLRELQTYVIDGENDEIRMKRNTQYLCKSITGLMVKLYLGIKQFRYKKNIQRKAPEFRGDLASVLRNSHSITKQLRRRTTSPIVPKHTVTKAQSAERMMKHQEESKRKWEEKKRQIMEERNRNGFLYVGGEESTGAPT